MEEGGGRLHFRAGRLDEKQKPKDQKLKAKSLGKNTHRSLAWGVLGLAIGGLLFSLLTLLFSGAVTA